jgi:mRNA interferase MazF
LATASNLKRGSVYWVNLEPTKGAEIKKMRPCVLLGASPINQARRTVLVVPLSTAGEPRPPITVAVHCQGREVRAVCDRVRAVDKSRLATWIEAMDEADLKKIGQALKQILALS